jgi:lipopolysaccharide export LptBFGC system permease protein LptF
MLSSGTGNVVNAMNSTALVSDKIYYNNRLQELNKKLIELNNKMLTISQSEMSQYDENSQETMKKEQQLQYNYNKLMKERIHIEEIAKEFQTVDSAYNNGSITLTSHYYSYIVFIFVVLFLLFLLFKFTIFNPQRGGGSTSKKVSFMKIFQDFFH